MYSTALSNSDEVGQLVIRTLIVNEKPVIVHSKLMIVDDEFVLVGNANISLRSMSLDSEIHLGIVDEKETFVRELRIAIWKEHLQLNEDESNKSRPDSIINRIKDPKEGVALFSSDKDPGARRLRPISDDLGKNPPDRSWEKYLMKAFIQPYSGPKMDMFE